MAVIFDKTVLEKEADFTLRLTIPESSYDVKNADGTSPVVSLVVKGSSIVTALSVLNQLNESQEFLVIAAEQIVGPDYHKLMKKDKGRTKVSEALSNIHSEFITFSFNATTEDNETVEFTLSAPSAIIGFQAFQAMTKPQKLQALAISFMPNEYDDEDDYYDDL
jgi:hypothetical protein